MKNHRPAFGHHGETLACEYLLQNKCRIIERGYRARFGEIDIIASEGNTLCFIEVKTRATDTYGAPEEAVTNIKQHHIIKTAEWYLNTEDTSGIEETRFDVIAITFNKNEPDICWIKNAFYADR